MMEEKHAYHGDNPIKRVLMSMQDTIACKGTVTKSMLRKLHRADVISQKQYDNLLKKKSTYIQIQELMKVIESKTDGFDLFLDVLQTEKSNGWIVKKVREKLVNLKKPKIKKPEYHQHFKSENPEMFDQLYSETFPLVFGKDEVHSFPQNLTSDRKQVHLKHFTKELVKCRDILDVDGEKDLPLREIIMKCKDEEAVQIKEQKKRYNKALLQQIEDNYTLQQEIIRLKMTMENREREKLNTIETEVHRRVKQRLLSFDQPINTKLDSPRGPRFPHVFQSEAESIFANDRQQSIMSNYSD